MAVLKENEQGGKSDPLCVGCFFKEMQPLNIVSRGFYRLTINKTVNG